MEKQKLTRKNKKKEVYKTKLNKRMVNVTHGDLLEEKKVDVVLNSVGSPVKHGFRGAIGQ